MHPDIAPTLGSTCAPHPHIPGRQWAQILAVSASECGSPRDRRCGCTTTSLSSVSSSSLRALAFSSRCKSAASSSSLMAPEVFACLGSCTRRPPLLAPRAEARAAAAASSSDCSAAASAASAERLLVPGSERLGRPSSSCCCSRRASASSPCVSGARLLWNGVKRKGTWRLAAMIPSPLCKGVGETGRPELRNTGRRLAANCMRGSAATRTE
mmetsp:Transcript_56872/g.101797  ORF Transcript_56872/g.101797 Transcript_56872/m.101797 type:complete len:212 (-) Transcript_56872:37-672(-)